MAVLGRIKQGTDVTFPTVTCTESEAPVDLSASGYVVTALFKPNEASTTFVTPAVASGPLADGEIVLSLTDEQTATMSAQTWKGDIKVVTPTGTRKSETYDIIVVEDVTP